MRREIVLVQHPAENKNYLLKLWELQDFAANSDTLKKIGPSTVTFVITDGRIQEIAPPFLRDIKKGKLSVLIQDHIDHKSYFFEYRALQKFRMRRKPTKKDYTISFIVPLGLEQVEEMPFILRELLQSGEAARVPDIF